MHLVQEVFKLKCLSAHADKLWLAEASPGISLLIMASLAVCVTSRGLQRMGTDLSGRLQHSSGRSV
jgi:hypothetical protein